MQRTGDEGSMPTRTGRRAFLKSLSLGAFTLSLPACAGNGLFERGGGKGESQPNIIFILIDDMGWKDPGFMGSTFHETPNIDRLAHDSMIFTNAYANAPNCAPSRASLLSGQYTPRHGIFTVKRPDRGKAKLRKLIPTPNKEELDPELFTLGKLLKTAGYRTASIGKWHLGKDPDTGPLAHGFDVNVAGGRYGHPPAGYFAPYKLPELEEPGEGEYLTDRLTDESLRFIEESRDRPFFLYLSHYAVHTPIQAKSTIKEKYAGKKGGNGQKNPAYAAMIESVDQGVGRIVEKLNDLGLADNTAIFFFSDNGGMDRFTSMAPLRGSKGMLYEGGIREPMFVHWPGRVRPGTVCHTPVIGIDFYPTIAAMVGAMQPPEHLLDGKSLMPLLLEEGGLHRSDLYWHFPAYLEAYKGMKGAWRTTPAGAVRSGDYKLIEFFEDGRLELYDLKEDPGEENDLSMIRQRKRDELHEKLKKWRKSTKAPVPSEPNPAYDPAYASKKG